MVPSEIAPWDKSCCWQRKQERQDCWERILILILWTHNETQVKWVVGKWTQVCELKVSEIWFLLFKWPRFKISETSFSTSVLEGTYVTRFIKLIFRNQRKTSSGSNLWQFTFAQPCQLEQSILFSCLRTASEIWIYSKCISYEKQLNRKLNWEFLDYSCTWYEKIRKKFPKTNGLE